MKTISFAAVIVGISLTWANTAGIGGGSRIPGRSVSPNPSPKATNRPAQPGPSTAQRLLDAGAREKRRKMQEVTYVLF